MNHTAQNGFLPAITQEFLLLSDSSLSSGSSSSSPYSISLTKVSGTVSDLVCLKTLSASCGFTAGVGAVNFGGGGMSLGGGGGGGGMDLGSGDMPLDVGWSNFFGAGKDNKFLTPASVNGSLDLKISEACHELEKSKYKTNFSISVR